MGKLSLTNWKLITSAQLFLLDCIDIRRQAVLTHFLSQMHKGMAAALLVLLSLLSLKTKETAESVRQVLFCQCHRKGSICYLILPS